MPDIPDDPPEDIPDLPPEDIPDDPLALVPANARRRTALSPAHLLTLGMFVFGMDTMAYDELTRRITWRHAETERFGARPASQYVGPGEDAITINGLIVPEIAGSYSAIDTLIGMADTGDSFPLLDGLGRVLGNFRIDHFEDAHHGIMAGGIPRGRAFTIELARVD